MSWKGILRKAGITAHENGDLTFEGGLYGSQIPGVPPYTNRLYVNKGVTASGNGSRWVSAYKTIAEAITVVNAAIDWAGSPWADGTEIHIAPGTYAENLTSLPYGGCLIGHGDAWDADGQRGVKIKPAAGSPVDVNSCINALFANINFESPDAAKVFDTSALNNVQFKHCRFAGAPEATTSIAGIYANDSTMLTVQDCLFQYLDCGIDFVYADGGDKLCRALIGGHGKGNYFTYISEAGIRISANLVVPANTICFNTIHGGGITLAVGIDNNSGSDIPGVFGNYIDATDAIQGIATNVGGNYVGGSTIE